ncbi:MAG TPA: ABC transporter ATP-binding protein [Acholeplasmatales bacterium]|nr:ABC transporter ATP-binding protein [Acholeplasmatales bacterium]
MRYNHVSRAALRVSKKNWLLLLMLAIVIAGVVLTSLIPPQILKRIVDDNLVPKTPDGLMNLALLYLGTVGLIAVFDFLKAALLTVIGQKVSKEIRLTMMRKAERINALYFSKNGTGNVVSRFTNDVEAINSTFTTGIIGLLIDCLKIIGIVVSVFVFNQTLGLIALALLPIIFLITRFVQKRTLQAQIQNRIQVGKVNNHISESLKNVLMIKSGSKEAYMERKYTRYLKQNFNTLEKVNFFDSIFPPIIQITRALAITLIVVLAIPDLNFIGITIGMVAASVELISDLFAPIENFGTELQNIQQSVSGIQRVNAFCDEEEEAPKQIELKAEDIIHDRQKVSLKFNDVSFNYEEGSEILSHVDLNIQPQEKVTFVGRTGVGKTTLFKLCMGLLKPFEGSITINDVDVCLIPNSEKRKIFGYVDQNFRLIRGTIGEQISMQEEGISKERIRQALDFVGMLEFVDSLEKGLDTPVKGEALFSQGQKQLLAIARAVVTDPAILLLDEITANLDSITENKIVSVLQKAGETHTILSISHRLSSMMACDTVVILENGRVRNSGSPEMLLKNDEWYQKFTALENLNRS